MNWIDSASARLNITDVFNAGFRLGANNRAAAGIQGGSEFLKDFQVHSPSPPAELSGSLAEVWRSGYEMGYRCGASDAELASVDVPGACGMFRGLGEQILEMMGYFKDL